MHLRARSSSSRSSSTQRHNTNTTPWRPSLASSPNTPAGQAWYTPSVYRQAHALMPRPSAGSGTSLGYLCSRRLRIHHSQSPSTRLISLINELIDTTHPLPAPLDAARPRACKACPYWHAVQLRLIMCTGSDEPTQPPRATRRPPRAYAPPGRSLGRNAHSLLMGPPPT